MYARAGMPKSPTSCTSSWKRSIGPSASRSRCAGVFSVVVVGMIGRTLDVCGIVLSGTAYVKREGAVAKVFECQHGGVVCRTKLRGESEDEVLRMAVAHAKQKHGVDLSQSKTLARYAQSLIREE